MKKRLLSIAIALSVSNSAQVLACGTKIPDSASDRGNYLCDYCDILDAELNKPLGADATLIQFLKSTVNGDIGRWKPNDTVTITNGSEWAQLVYAANGNFLIKNLGEDVGPGEPVNHDGEGNSCENNANTNSGGSGGGGYTGPTSPIYTPQPNIADQVWNWNKDNPSGSVGVSQAPGSASSFDYSSYYASYYASYYNNYYAQYYANYNPN